MCMMYFIGIEIVITYIYFKGCGQFTSHLRAAPRKYQLDLEIAKKSNFSKLAQNEGLRALVTKILF